MALPPITIEFILEGKLFDQRSWYQVPRVGDNIMLGPWVDEPRRIQTLYEVTNVVWGQEGKDEKMLQRQAVDVYIKKS